MWNCEDCGRLHFKDERKCNCIAFTVIDEEGEDHTVFAFDRDEAAKRFAKFSNENFDYYLMDGEVTITVDGVKFCISAEPDIHYNATQIND